MNTFLKGQDKIVCIVGESGSGKSTIARDLQRYGLTEIKSYSTRDPRFKGEDTHVFISDLDSKMMLAHENIIAYTFFNGHSYFATYDQFIKNDIYVIDPYGVEFLSKKVGRENIMVVYIKTSLYKRFYRMWKERGLKAAFSRIQHDKKAFRYLDYDKKVVNNTLEDLFYAPLKIVRWIKVWG